MIYYEVVIEVLPHSSHRGSVVDQMQAGAREQRFQVRAENIKEAMTLAEVLCLGIQQNPIVYQTPIKSIGQVEMMGYQGGPTAKALTPRGECYIK